MYISNILTRLPRNFSSREFVPRKPPEISKRTPQGHLPRFPSPVSGLPSLLSCWFFCLLLLFCSSLQWAPLTVMIKSMSLSFWNNLRLFQNNKPLVIFLNHFSNTSFFLGLYQVLLRSSLFKICLVGDVYLKRLKWCVVICPKSQMNRQWALNYFVRMSLSPSNSRLVKTGQWTLTVSSWVTW